jgi:hypothetical protein
MKVVQSFQPIQLVVVAGVQSFDRLANSIVAVTTIGSGKATVSGVQATIGSRKATIGSGKAAVGRKTTAVDGGEAAIEEKLLYTCRSTTKIPNT